jgi:hypothetical protein
MKNLSSVLRGTNYGTLPVANGGTGVITSTGSGSVVLSTSPSLVTPILGTPASGTLTNCTGYTYANLASKPTTASGFGLTDVVLTNTVGAANGVAPLGSDSKIPSTYLPSYVDDVLEYANLAGFPATGETAKIFVALDTNKIYRWSGSAYVEISPTAGNADTATKLATSRSISTTGDATWTVNFDGSANATAAITLADVVTAGTGTKVTYNAKGLITGSTTLTVSDITDIATSYQAKHANLTAVAGLSTATTGLIKFTNGVASFDSNTYVVSSSALGTPSSGDLANCTNAIGYSLKSATTSVSVSAATAPSTGQVLTATSSTTATWQAINGLPTQTSNSGKFLTTDGTNASWATLNAGLNVTAAKTATYTALAYDLVNANTTSSAFSVTLPASPVNGAIVGVIDMAGTFATNNLTLLPGAGATIESDTSLILDINSTYITLVYISATTNWKVQGTPSATVSGTGTGSIVYATSPTLITPILGVASATSLTLSTALSVANGGTGATTLTANNVLLGNGTSALQAVAPGTSGNLLTSNGTTWVSSSPPITLPTQTSNSGKFLTTDGTNASWATLNAGLNVTAAKTATYTALAYDLVNANTTAGAFSVTLPVSPVNGAIVGVIDMGGTFATNNLTLLPGAGATVENDTSLILDINSTYITLVYISATTNWKVQGTPAATVSGTGTGAIVYATSPTLITPLLGTPTSGTLTNCTGYTFANLETKPTTLSGYGITDAILSSTIGAASGIAPLGSDSKISSTYLPSYVDDVLEYANLAGFPATGETAKIYVALDTNKIYRWSGSAYIEISPTAGNADTATTLATSRSISTTGDATWTVNFNGSANATAAITLASVVTAGTGTKVTYNAKGLITGSTTLTVSDITDIATSYQAKHANLTTIAGLSTSSTGLIVLTNGVASLDTSTHLISGGVLGTPSSGDLANCTNAIGYSLKSATTSISVSAATAPSAGQVLTASSSTAASWTTINAGLNVTATKIANYTAVAYDLISANSTAGVFNITMPASPVNGAVVGVIDIAGTFATNNVTVLPGAGATVQGDTAVVLDINNTYVTFVYIAASTNWRVQSSPSRTASGTGTGAVVYATSPTLITPALGTPTSGTLTNCTGYTYANLSGTTPIWNQDTSGTAAGLSATLAVASGGTGSTTLTANNVLLGNGTSALQAVAPGTSGNLLTSNGTTWVSSAPPITLPTQTSNSGKYLTTDGSNASWSTIVTGLQVTAITTSAYTAAVNDLVRCNTTSAAVTITFPASPVDGATIGIIDVAKTFATYNVTVLPGAGATIEGDTSAILDISGTYLTFIYVSSTTNWRMQLTPSPPVTGTGSGSNVLSISPTLSTSILTDSSSFSLLNTTATTVNFAGAATTLNIGASTGTLTVNNSTVVGSQTTQALWNTVATTVNFAGAATTLNIGASTGTTSIKNNLSVTGNIYATGDVYSSYSDILLKTVTGKITNALDSICAIETFYYKPNELALSLGIKDDGIKVGVNAQSVQKVAPEVVGPSAIDEEFLTVQYERLVPYLIESIKELREEIAVLKEKLNGV